MGKAKRSFRSRIMRKIKQLKAKRIRKTRSSRRTEEVVSQIQVVRRRNNSRRQAHRFILWAIRKYGLRRTRHAMNTNWKGYLNRRFGWRRAWRMRVAVAHWHAIAIYKYRMRKVARRRNWLAHRALRSYR